MQTRNILKSRAIGAFDVNNETWDTWSSQLKTGKNSINTSGHFSATQSGNLLTSGIVKSSGNFVSTVNTPQSALTTTSSKFSTTGSSVSQAAQSQATAFKSEYNTGNLYSGSATQSGNLLTSGIVKSSGNFVSTGNTPQSALTTTSSKFSTTGSSVSQAAQSQATAFKSEYNTGNLYSGSKVNFSENLHTTDASSIRTSGNSTISQNFKISGSEITRESTTGEKIFLFEQSKKITKDMISSSHYIIGEKIEERVVMCPKKRQVEQIVEKVYVEAEKVKREEMVDDLVKWKERILEVKKPIYYEKDAEIQQEIVYKDVEQIQYVTQEKIREVPKIVYEEKIREVPVVIPREKLIEVPQIEYREIPVEKIVEIAEVKEKIVFREIPGPPRYVDVPVPESVDVEIEETKERFYPVPVEAHTSIEIRVPKLRTTYESVQLPIYVPRIIEVPLPAEIVDAETRFRCDALSKDAATLAANAQSTSCSLCDCESLGANLLHFENALKSVQLSEEETQMSIMQCFKDGRLQVDKASFEKVWRSPFSGSYTTGHALIKKHLGEMSQIKITSSKKIESSPKVATSVALVEDSAVLKEDVVLEEPAPAKKRALVDEANKAQDADIVDEADKAQKAFVVEEAYVVDESDKDVTRNSELFSDEVQVDSGLETESEEVVESTEEETTEEEESESA
eukprot:GHVP01010437.1.p1 GENE.GHVP01010437.1~~GHVP01010437.1.p1  ORF type:complete len:681 (+),score=134.41 GHVP01010437.1:34-2076(+)